MFGNLGAMEIIFLGLVFIIIFGGKKLPEIGKFLGEGLKEFRKATQTLSLNDNDKDSFDEKNKIIQNQDITVVKSDLKNSNQ